MTRSRSDGIPLAAFGTLAAVLAVAFPAWTQSIPGITSEAKKPPPAATDPLKRTSPRSAIYAFLQACHSGQYELGAQYLDLRRLRADQRSTRGPELAKDLCQILDRDTHFELSRLSNDAEGNTLDQLAADLDELTSLDVNAATVKLRMQRVTQGDLSVWLVSSDSVSQIPKLLATFDESDFEKKLPESLVRIRFIGTSLWVWIALVLAALLLSLASRAFAKIFLLVLRPIAQRYAMLHAHRLEAFIEPVRFAVSIMVFGALVAIIGPSALVRDYLHNLLTLLFVLSCASILMRTVDVVSDSISSRLDPRQRAFSYSVLPLLVRAVKIVVFSIAVLFVLAAWGYNTNAILAGLGVGGVAVALASQKTIENLFGGISVISDRPVLVGDVCQFGGQVGTVEDIGLRSTRIRTPDRTLVTVPNSQFSTMTLENYSKRDRMLFKPTLALRRDTQPDDIRKMMDAVAQILRDHPEVDPTAVPLRFSKITKESFDLDVFSYVLTTDGDQFLRVQNELLLKIIEAAISLKVEFAVPIHEMVAPSLQLPELQSSSNGVRSDQPGQASDAYQSERKISK
ncbi:MAG: mechanosensitive ion channel family protein [Bryobacteraceae bacterium]